jgi:DNA-binding MarR family transcriptional regulator
MKPGRQRQGGFLIGKIHRTAGRIFARMLRECNIEINPAQGRILFVLWQGGAMPVHELARRTSLGKSTLTSMLDRLEALGQVVRVRSQEDRRQIVIELTAKNKAVHGVYEQVSRKMTELFYRGFTIREIDRFEHDLERILGNLQAVDGDGEEETK